MQPETSPVPGRLPIQMLKRHQLLEREMRLFFVFHTNALFHSVICILFLFFAVQPSGTGAERLLLILLSTVALFDGGLPCDKSSKRRELNKTVFKRGLNSATLASVFQMYQKEEH